MSRRSKPQGLVYIGRASLPGLPARDLRAEEVEALGGVEALLATGLYAVGGPVDTGTTYLVDEDEPELLVPDAEPDPPVDLDEEPDADE